MAEVFLAVTGSAAMAFSKLVVVKKPREHLADDLDFVTMLVDEGRIAARLNHPNLVQTHEVGEVNGQYFLTMEYLDGQPLHRILSRARGTMPIDMLVSILADVLGGMHYAHELKDYDGTSLQIVHRDVTPQNCFVTYEGQVKVVDFGIAKAIGRASETRHGVVKGKTAYMAPEQACGQEVDRRVDVFAIGVVLFEAVARARMWKGVSETDIIRKLVAGDIPSSPKAVNPEVDDELDRICKRALMFSPADRYPTAAAFQMDLEKYLVAKGSRPSARNIGAYIAELFADKRATTDKIIGTQLAHLKTQTRVSLAELPAGSSSSDERSVTVTTPAKNPLSQHAAARGANGSSVSRSPHALQVSQGSPASRAPASLPSEAFPRSSNAPGVDEDAQKTVAVVWNPVLSGVTAGARTFQGLGSALRNGTRGLVPLIAVAVLLAAATAALTIVSFSPTRANANTASPIAGPVKAKMITLTLRATPPETRFSIDNGPLQDNPFTGQVDGDGREHVIHAVAPGYSAREETATFTNDMSMRFTLSAIRKP